MRPLVAHAFIVVLAFAGSARAELHVRWSSDGRFAFVTSSFNEGVSATQSDSTVVELSTGKRSSWSAQTYSCNTGDDTPRGTREAEQCWKDVKKRGDDYEAKNKAWLRDHPAVDAVEQMPAGASLSGVRAGDKIHAKLVLPGVLPGGVVREVDVKTYDTDQVVALWSPDAQWALLASNGSDEMPWVIVAGIARVDLLDAGAGSLDAAAAKLKTAGFVAAHAGKSQSAHAKTAIFYAVGFEADAKQITRALGLDASAAKPVTWSTPFAITVALAKSTP